ncbi:hypothetical protein EVAR_63183_1 [Eumeta japonica]|uniref:Uncharacterized protein n=1 Tax=Eumeta variegata TaxID=151549 RepID=A0A4C2A144_EUMVA|nr:hypothetical protein EVAR_63183_1 [Eumeta japonica]
MRKGIVRAPRDKYLHASLTKSVLTDRRKDGQQSDPIKIPLFPYEEQILRSSPGLFNLNLVSGPEYSVLIPRGPRAVGGRRRRRGDDGPGPTTGCRRLGWSCLIQLGLSDSLVDSPTVSGRCGSENPSSCPGASSPRTQPAAGRRERENRK